MDIGIWMTAETLESKLEHRYEKNPEAAWNMAKWPKGFTGDPKIQNRLFVASGKRWIGYFIISPDMLYLPEDKKTPYVLLFDTRTWTPIDGGPAKRFRGFTYKVPELVDGVWRVPDRTDAKKAEE